MRKSTFSEEQSATALRQIDVGAPVLEVTRKLGISEATYYVWRKRNGQMATQAARGRSDLGVRSSCRRSSQKMPEAHAQPRTRAGGCSGTFRLECDGPVGC